MPGVNFDLLRRNTAAFRTPLLLVPKKNLINVTSKVLGLSIHILETKTIDGSSHEQGRFDPSETRRILKTF